MISYHNWVNKQQKKSYEIYNKKKHFLSHPKVCDKKHKAFYDIFLYIAIIECYVPEMNQMLELFRFFLPNLNLVAAKNNFAFLVNVERNNRKKSSCYLMLLLLVVAVC